MSDDRIEVLVVEDEPADVKLLQLAFGKGSPRFNIHVVRDGEAALDYLTRSLEGGPRPNLVILDINIPKVDGFGVLERIKSHPRLKSTPTILFSCSSNPKDVARAYGLHANAYVVKPSTVEEYVEALSALQEFWGSSALLPV